MASNQSIFDKLNLSSGERRLFMIVIVVLMLALMWMVWGMIPSPSATKQEIAKAQTQLNSFQGEIKKTDDYFEAKAKVSMREGFNKAFVTHKTMDFDTEPTEAEATEAIEKDYPHLKVERIDWIRDMSYNQRIRTLQGLGSAVIKIEQQTDMRKFINQLTTANGVDIDSTTSADPKTSEFFIEQSMTIRFSSKESDLVNFLWKLGSSDTMVRVSQMRVNPDKNRYRLSGSMTLTASYQKDVKATKPKPATEAKAKPVAAKPAAKPEPAKPKAETKPAKPSGTKRTIPTRRARKTQ